MKGVSRLWIVAPILVLAACGPGAPGPQAEAPADRPDVLIVTLDTARADHFSYTGESQVNTPNVDRLAAEGTSFLAAVAPSPITLPSHASLFTGLLPPSHGVRNNGTYRLAPEMTTLAEVLSAAGYETAAFVAAAVLDRRYGLDQGFDHYDDAVGPAGNAGLFQYPRRPGDQVVAAALDWLEQRSTEAPTLVWVHLYDPHIPYDPPELERSQYPDSPYAAAIAASDRVIGTLLDGYRQRRGERQALTVLTSDHGESLGEHGESTHGIFLYDATLRIPLVLHGPGIEAGRQVGRQVQLVDIFPTLLGLLGLSPGGALDGDDLEPLLAGRDSDWSSSPAYAESLLPREQYGWADLTALRTEKWKLIVGARDELYDLAADPRESTDLAAQRPEQIDALRRQLPDESADSERLELDEATRARLGALGYLSSSAAPTDVPRHELPDPRERIVERRRMIEAIDRFANGDRDGAIAVYREIAVEEPGNFLVRAQLGDLLSIVGRHDEAFESYSQAEALMPDRADLQNSLGRCLEILGRPEEALAAYDRALAVDPWYRPVRERRWRLLHGQGRAADVAGEARQAIAEEPEDVGAHLALALSLEAVGDPAAALAAIERGLDEAGRQGDLVAALARFRIAAGQVAEGVELYREVLLHEPSNAEAAGGFAHVLLARNQVPLAKQVLAGALDPSLPDPKLAVLMAEAHARSGELEPALKLAEGAAVALPSDPRAWATLGSVRRMAGRLDGSAEAYRKALELAPGDRTTALNLQAVQQALGNAGP